MGVSRKLSAREFVYDEVAMLFVENLGEESV